jgi:predicted ATPase
LLDGDTQMLRIALTGPHGTGKTTIIRTVAPHLDTLGTVAICREAPRLIIDRVGDPEFFRRESNTTSRQALIFAEHLMEERRAAQNSDVVISDRTLVDHLSYTTVLFPESETSAELRVYREIAFESLSAYDAIFQLPIEFAPVDDGVRESDLQFQREIDEKLGQLYAEAGVVPTIIRGSVDERRDQILAHIASLTTS